MKLENKLLRNIMTKGVVTVQMNATVKEIANLMTKHVMSGVAVVGPNSEIVGVISDIDLIKMLEKEEWENVTAESIMTSNIISARPTMTIGDAANIMKEKNIHRLFICAEPCLGSKKPIGILSASDIVREMTNLK